MSHVPLGKYELIAELGRGGMADVFLAVSRGPAGLGFSKLVVIKRLRSHLAGDPEFVGMLVEEARIAARLNHPNVVQTVEIGEAEGEYFLAMEYLDGQPLRQIQQRVTKGAVFPKDMHFLVLHETLAGLHHAHELRDFDGTPLNIVHRDVTPHNIFVTYDGHVKVVDFGIAKAVGRAAETRHGMVKGKAPYMAPEQARGEIVDRRADVFAVGIMLWEAATGKRFWGDSKENQILSRLAHRQLPDPSPRAADPSVPEAVDAICRKALAPLDERYRSAAEFEADLHQYLESLPERVSTREMSTVLTNIFADKRAELSRIIEKQLVELGDTRASPLSDGRIPPKGGRLEVPKVPQGSAERASVPPSENTSSVLRPQPSSEADLAPPTSDISGEEVPPTTTMESTRFGSRTRILVYAAIAVAALLALASGLLSGRPSRRARPAGSEDAGNGSAALADSEISVSLRANPSTARFRIDDGPPLDNPSISKRPKDGREHVVVVEAEGYAPVERHLTFSDDVSLQLSLSRTTGGSVPGKPK